MVMQNASTAKPNGSPQFPGQQPQAMGDGNMDLSNQLQNMPSVANQPITSIFNPISSNLLSTPIFDQAPNWYGDVPQTATPMTGATQIQQPLIQPDFQLPGSAFYGDTQGNQHQGAVGLQG